MSGKIISLPLFKKIIGNLGLFFSFRILEILLHSFTPCIVSYGKSVAICVMMTLYDVIFSFITENISSLLLVLPFKYDVQCLIEIHGTYLFL